MGKRSNFERTPRDFYPTPKEAVIPLIPELPKNSNYAEPCAGEGDLARHLWDTNRCSAKWMSDIEFGYENLSEKELAECSYIVTNPPWDRKILHPMIEHFRNLRPTWLLFDADWMHTKQSKDYIKYCSKIISVGRIKWIPDSKMTGKDNCCWYFFNKDLTQTEFIGR